jgi:hypothetical protein
MARYSMHLRDGTEKLLDPEALEFPSIEALQAAVSITARRLLNRDAGNGMLDSRFRVDAEDESGAIVYSLSLKHAHAELRPVPGPANNARGESELEIAVIRPSWTSR